MTPNDWLNKEDLTDADLDQLEQTMGEANHKYRFEDTKVMTDQEYDDLSVLLSQHGREIPMWSYVPADVKTADIPHVYDDMVCTLGKVNNIEQLREWILRDCKIPANQNIVMVVSLKFDGNSGLVDYSLETGKAIGALSRGDDGKGVDLSGALGKHRINADPLLNGDVGIKYEIILTYDDLERVAEKRGKALVNPRSAISGVMGRDDAGDYFPFVKLVPLGVKYKDGTEMSREDEFCLMNELLEGCDNILEPEFTVVEGTPDEVCATISEMYEEMSVGRKNLDYMVDGMVIEFLEEDIRQQLGWHKGSTKVMPKHSIALKFPYMEASSKVVRMEFDYGRSSGRITPCVRFEPVKFFGTTHTRQSIANYSRFKELQLGVGTHVLIEYRNDTLSYVNKLDVPENEGIAPIPFIDACPKCGAEIRINEAETFAYCSNVSCMGRVIGGAQTWLIKLGVKGIGESTLERCYDAGLLRSLSDLYTMDYDKVAKLEGMGKSSAQKMKDAILAKKEITDWELIGSIGIEGIGRSTCREVFKVLSIEDVLNACFDGEGDRLLLENNVPGIAEVNARKIQEGVQANEDFIYWAVDYFDIKETPKGMTGGKTFVVTGELVRWSRPQLKTILENMGHKVTGSVSRNTNYLVTNDPTSGTKKNKDAQRLGVSIITEDQLVELVDGLG